MGASMYKYFFIILFISASITQTSNNKKYQNVRPNSIELWENENKKIKNPKLKKELIKLNDEFQNMRKKISDDFKEKIKPLKIQKDKDISNLKDDYLDKRKLLFKKYGIKTDPQFQEQKRKNGKNKQPLPFYKKGKLIPKNKQ